MTKFQVLALVALAGAAAWTYIPSLRFSWPTPSKPNTLGHIKNVMAIRESSASPAIRQAANALLQALLETT